MSQNVDLVSLAESIADTAKALAAQLKSSNSPLPSFAVDGPSEYPKVPEVIGLRFQLIDAINDLFRLAMGPNDMAFMNPISLNHDVTVLDTLNEFDFWNAVPLDGSATYSEIARATSLPESIVRRFLRYAITIRVFAPASPGSDSIVHTSQSAVFVKQPILRSWLAHNFREVRPGSVHVPEALSLYSLGKEKASEDVMESGFVLANVDRLEKRESWWDYMNRDVPGKPKGFRATRFSESMQAVAANLPLKSKDLLRAGYDWSKLGSATVVDVGGSSGIDALAVAESFPDLKFVVQDLADVAPSFEAKVPSTLRDRISFQAYNFFDPQPQTNVQVLMMKTVLHDWPNAKAAEIVRNQLPVIQGGARLLLIEGIMPPDDAPLPTGLRRSLAAADMQMWAPFNSQERSLDEWKAVLKEADEHLEVTYVSQVPGAMHNFIEVTYQA